MTLQEKETLKILAAILLVMLEPNAFWLGAWIAGGVLLTVHLFRLLQPLFPKKIFRFAALLWSAVFLMLSFRFTKDLYLPESSIWAFSFFVLLDWREFETKTLAPNPFPLLLRLGLFEGSLASLSFFQSIFPEVSFFAWMPLVFLLLTFSGKIQARVVRAAFQKKRPA